MSSTKPSDKKLQLDKNGNLCHFLTIDGLELKHLSLIMDTAEKFIDSDNNIKKTSLLENKTVVNLFFEPSTRTRTTFEIAAKRLKADVINLSTQRMSTSKGETLLDTLRNLEAMYTDMFVIRDSHAGAAYLIAQHAKPGIRVINAGDGRHAHPTQAMLDMFTIRRYKQDFKKLKVAIVGDILHSRVARSQIQALKILGAKEIRVIAPNTLLPTGVENLGVHAYTDMSLGLKDVDVVIMLRLQRERMLGQLIASEQEYFNLYGLTQEKLAYAKDNAIVMHPGPINRGLEIASDVADSKHSVILQQVSHGIAIRMAIMALTMNESGKEIKV